MICEKSKTMKKIFTLLGIGVLTAAYGQFVSPGTGVTYNLASLSAAAPTVLVDNGPDYQMTANITISAGDNLVLDENTTLRIDPGLVLTVAGNYDTTATNFTITATDPANIFKGIRLESTASATFRNTIYEYGGGIQALTGNFLMENCIVRYNKSGQSTGAAINFSTGNPIVRNSQFIENDLPAVASGGTNSVALEFTGNYLKWNNRLNQNRPQINMGPTGSGTTRILNNTVIGDRTKDRVGGIGVSVLIGSNTVNVLIDGNTITDNRYGMTITGVNTTGTISNNTFTNNNVETNPMNGGSGINLLGSGTFKIEKNQIRGHFWGISLQTQTKVDLGGGALGSVGENVFANNGNGGVLYALYNNTSNAVSATNNCWREGELATDAMVEEVISHQVDNANLGLVTFSPYLCAAPLATAEVKKKSFKVYPVPNNGNFTLDALKSGNILITDSAGRVVYSGIVSKGKNEINFNAKAGVYILVYQDGNSKSAEKFIVQ